MWRRFEVSNENFVFGIWMIGILEFFDPRACCHNFIQLATLAFAICQPIVLAAQDVAEPTVVEVASGLKYPSGIAIQPETNAIFVADSGNGQVIRIVDGKASAAITGFPLRTFEPDPSIQLGPLGLLFVDKNTLWVGSGGNPDGSDVLHVFSLSGSADATTADSAQLKVWYSGDPRDPRMHVAPIYSIAATSEAIYLSGFSEAVQWRIGQFMRGDEDDSSSKATIVTFVDTNVAAGAMRPCGITISPHGYVVAGTIGELDTSGDSLLLFYDTVTRTKLLSLETGLHDITAVAYSPRKQLYVADLAWSSPGDGGIYQVIADASSKTGMRTQKIASLEHPTAMAFDLEGSLYVTVAGSADPDGNRQGKLMRIEGL